MVTEEERQWMWQEYAPQARMRLNLGIRRRLAPLLDNDRRKIELANSLLFTLTGSPVIYYGDEIGMGDEIELPDRNGVRTPMQWNAGLNAGFSTASPDELYAPIITKTPYGPDLVNVAAQQQDTTSLWHALHRMILVRKSNTVLGSGDLTWIDTSLASVIAYRRSDALDSLFILNNLSGKPQRISIALSEGQSLAWTDLFDSHKTYQPQNGLLSLELAPYQYLWLRQGNHT